MALRAAIFDLDGTLVDSAEDIAEAINRLYDDLGQARVAPVQVQAWIGDGVRALVGAALSHKGLEVSVDEVMPGFLVHYNATLLLEPRVYAGVVEALDVLKAAGVPLGICTNKPVDLVPPLLAHLGLEHYFDVVIGGGSLPQRKPDAAPLLAVAGALDVPVTDCLMVGDSGTDHAAAMAAGMPVALVRYGYPRTFDLDAAPTLAVVDDLRQLLPAFGLTV